MKNTTLKTQNSNEMNRDAFWEVIAEAQKRKNSYDNNLLGDGIMEVLEEKYSNAALVQFHLLIPIFREELAKETYGVAQQILPGSPFWPKKYPRTILK